MLAKPETKYVLQQQIYGRDAKNPLWIKPSGNLVPQPLLVRESPMNYNPKKLPAVSPNQIQFSPAYLYDYVTYPAAGMTGSPFFGRSQTSQITAEDTNMQQANNVGAGNIFLIEFIWVQLILGIPTVSAGAEATLAGANALRDYQAVMSRGYLQFYLNGLPQMGNGVSPLLLAASPVSIGVGGGVGAGVSAMQALTPAGINSGYNTKNYPIQLDDTQNFSAQITFPGGAVALPSSNATSKIGMVLLGRQYRPAG